eukprot:365415-Chlamydomonas_euryale.AAC.12
MAFSYVSGPPDSWYPWPEGVGLVWGVRCGMQCEGCRMAWDDAILKCEDEAECGGDGCEVVCRCASVLTDGACRPAMSVPAHKNGEASCDAWQRKSTHAMRRHEQEGMGVDA